MRAIAVENGRCARDAEAKSVIYIIIVLGRVMRAKHPAKAL